MSLWGGSSGDMWANLGGQIAGIVGNIYNTKAQTKLLRQMNRLNSAAFLGAARGQGLAGPVMNLGGASPMMFSGVPAAGGGLGGLLGPLGGILGGAAGGILSGGGLGLNLPGGLEEIGSGTGVFGPDLFEPARSGQRARQLIRATNPTTGNDTYWRHVGAPMLFRGDLRVAKLVNKVAARASRGRARCRTFRKRR